ncbi:hypothetical protein [Altericroceibacterium endophyticum]|uniref:Uncharacterized protein n=1 Tax=Altericroceibacterium endophyticum TaxID=1808508 RepID=A0A6I4T8F5_9SPHN|nr:hypothetical protein [Altericroceibacterium endophyticum]MXO66542.1 hypothetical protein [Altericroceibacterium endophyticum]
MLRSLTGKPVLYYSAMLTMWVMARLFTGEATEESLSLTSHMDMGHEISGPRLSRWDGMSYFAGGALPTHTTSIGTRNVATDRAVNAPAASLYAPLRPLDYPGYSSSVTPYDPSAQGLASGRDMPEPRSGLISRVIPSRRDAQLAEFGTYRSSVPLAPGPLTGRQRLSKNGRPDRLSVDSWMFVRKDGSAAISGAPTYGGSQAGAILRYRFKPSSGLDPFAYIRSSSALRAKESELSAGVAARPLASAPLRLAAEMQLHNVRGRKEWRPALYGISEVPPFSMPLGLEGEMYVQGGYVGGDYSTYFTDGQLRADRRLLSLKDIELYGGLGIWGGAQKGVQRLDMGPSARMMLDVYDTPARVTLDWRMKVAGNAEPSSGPALTISAGF